MPLRFLLLPPDVDAFAVTVASLRLGFFDGDEVVRERPSDMRRALADARFALEDRAARWELAKRGALGRAQLLRAETDPVACNPVAPSSEPVLGLTMRFGDTTIGDDYVVERLFDPAFVSSARSKIGRALVLAAPVRGTLFAGHADAVARAAELAWADARAHHPTLALDPTPVAPGALAATVIDALFEAQSRP